MKTDLTMFMNARTVFIARCVSAVHAETSRMLAAFAKILKQSSGVAMHFLVGLGILAGFIGFAFGENAARAFVGIILAGAVALAIGFAWACNRRLDPMTSTDRRAVWERVPGLHEISNGKNKVYRNMVRFERPCRTCQEPFGIYVNEHCADNEGHNSNFGLRNCEKHRMRMVAAGSTASVRRAGKMRMANKCMKRRT